MKAIQRAGLAALLSTLLLACPAADNAAPAPVSLPASAPLPDDAAPAPVSLPASAPLPDDAAPPPATGLSACEPLPIRCIRAIASRHEDDHAIVYITPGEQDRARPGQWVRCAHEDRPPSPPCRILDIVDSGMLEASCPDAAPRCP